ncbi:hypothetical protein DPMN_039027 [Dreissena polymorpha]|uniref:Uncharacterized protein n=1 Tax=Dreissena polymorpha TaxID=45954 RepID=A0A9D4MGG3_DREPO|nr:hypothetical protein DPMN_039027 [Dreissena polymorpha]
MMNEGPKLIRQLPKIRQAVISHPEPMMWYSEKRLELEILDLMYMTKGAKCSDMNGEVNKSDTMLTAIEGRMNEILREIRQRMNWEGSRLNDLQVIYHMMLM